MDRRTKHTLEEFQLSFCIYIYINEVGFGMVRSCGKICWFIFEELCNLTVVQPDRDGIKSIVYDIAFRPDGTQLVAAVGNRVLVYDAADGDLLHSLKGISQLLVVATIHPHCLVFRTQRCSVRSRILS